MRNKNEHLPVFLGVLTPVPGWPSLRGYWTLRVSKRSTLTHSSNRLLTEKDHSNILQANF